MAKKDDKQAFMPIITSYSFIRVKGDNFGGFTTIKLITQGNQVLSTEILDEIGPLSIAENSFKAMVAREMLFNVPNTTVDIEWKEGKYQWKS